MEKNRLKIGIRGHDLPGSPFTSIDDFISTFKKYDLDYLQLVYKKAFLNYEVTEEALISLSKKLSENNINVAMVGAYFNMIHPDKQKLDNGIAYFKDCMKTAHLFNCNLVGSETGSLNGDKWIYVDGNHTKEAFLKVKEVVSDLKEFGKNYQTYPLIEGAWNHVVYKPTLLKELLDDLELDYCTVDLYNYLNIDNHLDHMSIFKEAISLLKDKIKVFHIKDYIVKDNKLVQVGIGKGLMNYQEIIPLIIENCPNSILILEGVTGDDIAPSIQYLRSFE